MRLPPGDRQSPTTPSVAIPEGPRALPDFQLHKDHPMSLDIFWFLPTGGAFNVRAGQEKVA